jgi:hypothetical protein
MLTERANGKRESPRCAMRAARGCVYTRALRGARCISASLAAPVAIALASSLPHGRRHTSPLRRSAPRHPGSLTWHALHGVLNCPYSGPGHGHPTW